MVRRRRKTSLRVALVTLAMTALVPVAVATGATWAFKDDRGAAANNAVGVTQPSHCIAHRRAGYLNYGQGWNVSGGVRCLNNSTTTPKDGNLSDDTMANGTQVGLNPGNDKYQYWAQNVTSGQTWYIYTGTNCTGSGKPFTNSWSDFMHRYSYKRSGATCP